MFHLLGDPKKAENELGWKPKTSFKELVKMMVEKDCLAAEKERVLMQQNLLNPTWEHPISI